MLNLHHITAICVDGTPDGSRLERLIRVISSIKSKIIFKDILYFSNVTPNCGDLCKFVPISPLKNLNEYSQFIILDLPYYINTPFCMTIHDDGFPINPHLWKDEFSKFDYIGAPWGKSCLPSVSPHMYYNMQVEGGNGGFSIRSKKFMEIGKKIALSVKNPTIREYVASGGFLHEDGYFCYHIRDLLKKAGMSFAPYEISKQFALETDLENHHNDIRKVFGFHGFRHINFDNAIAMLREEHE